MSVTSYLFLLFFLITMIIYYIVPKKCQWIILLGSSMIFYAYAGVRYLLFLTGTAAVVYGFSLWIQKNLDRQEELVKDADRRAGRKIKEEMKAKRKPVLTAGLLVIIIILAVFKGTTFAIRNLNHFLSMLGKENISVIRLMIPLGISYYSFMMISYLVDLYHGRIHAEKNFLKYLTYVLYFPHVTQGPIGRYEETAPKLFVSHAFDYDRITKGSWLMLWGFFKKLVIADHISPLVTEVFGNSGNYKGLIFLFAAVLYSIQIYCDFSGCMDIVCGVSECFGIKLTENFLRPYFSQTLPEFWRRWHVSLGVFFREYVFYPISTSGAFLKLNTKARAAFGNETGRNLAACVPILCVWILTGVWHGAGWNYIGWGLYHGILISLSTVFSRPLAYAAVKLKVRTESRLWMIFRMLRTFFLCVIGRIIFMGKGIGSSMAMLKSCLTEWRVIYPILETFNITRNGWILIVLSTLLLLCVSIWQEKLSRVGNGVTIRDWLAQRNIVIRWTILIGGIMLVLIFGVYGTGGGKAFIYEQF